MNKKEERDKFWISVGPESGYLGTIAEETARKNDGGISPDGKRLGWKNACDNAKKPKHPSQGEADYCCPPCDNQKPNQPDKRSAGNAPDCDCRKNDTAQRDLSPDCDCTPNCNCPPSAENGAGVHSTDYLPIWANSTEGYMEPLPGMIPIPGADLGPEQQNTWGNE